MYKKIGIILGSGLDKFSKELSSPKIIFQDNNSFHSLKILSGNILSNDIILFSGRRHFYEGYSTGMVLENVDIAKKLGVDLLIITNAAGGINSRFNVSDLMLITSHFNLLSKNLHSKNHSVLYNGKFLEKIKQLALKEKIVLRQGSYCCTNGPMYETKSEIKFLTKFGIDAVGMSTVPEILYANKTGMKTIAFSCITNLISGSSESITKHEEVIEAGKVAYSNFSDLLKLIISSSGELFSPV